MLRRPLLVFSIWAVKQLRRLIVKVSKAILALHGRLVAYQVLLQAALEQIDQAD